MSGVSGCFGGQTAPIDDMEDVTLTVDEIVNENPGENSSVDDTQMHLFYYQSVERRIKMLTLVVVALAVVVLAKEL